MSFISDAFKSVSNLNVFTAQLDMFEKMLPQLMEQFQSLNIVADIISDAIQMVGDALGIDQSIIDLAQAAFRAQLGDLPGALIELGEAMEGLKGQDEDRSYPAVPPQYGQDMLRPGADPFKDLPLSDREFLNNQKEELSNELSSMLMDLLLKMMDKDKDAADEKIGGTSGSDGKEGPKSFFQLLALMLGEIMADKFDDMMNSMDKLREVNNEKLDRTDKKYKSKRKGSDTFQNDMQEKGREFSIAQSEYQAHVQMYSQVQNMVNTTLKSVGESMITLSKKQ